MATIVESVTVLEILLFLSIGSYIVSIVSVRIQGPKAPLVGFKSILEPRLIANYRFFKDAAAIINEGYSKAGRYSTMLISGLSICSRRRRRSSLSEMMQIWWYYQSLWSRRLELYRQLSPIPQQRMHTIF